MTAPVITLPNGETIRKGEYGVTRDGQKVGPILIYTDDGFFHTDGTSDLWLANGEGVGNPNIIAKWHPVEAEDFPTSKWRRLCLPPKPTPPNYNDGNWHAWHGGQCPVHPQSVVEYLWHDTNQNRFGSAQRMAGYDENHERPAWQNVIRFRVITPYAEPAPEAVKPAKRDLRTIDEPFYSLDKKTQGRLRKADAKGFPLQTRGFTHDGSTGSEWGAISKSGWYREETVRLDPTFTPPAKRATFWLTNGRVFQSAQEAKTAYPGSDPVKVRECKK